jgi:hypothetical protein
MDAVDTSRPSRTADHPDLSEIIAQARKAFQTSRVTDLRRVSISEDEGRLVLAGTVGSFYIKQLAQELLRLRANGVEISNALQVTYPPPTSQDGFMGP